MTITLVLLGHSLIFAAEPPADRRIPKAQTQQLDVAYRVNEDALPLRAVELWYTFDQGKSWHNYGRDEDSTSPMSFFAPQEGLCGLYLVITNATGSSGSAPSADTEPHLWMFIDYTPPIAQIHSPDVVHRPGGQAIARLRWTAIDANLLSRPIDLAYRVLPDGAWLDVKRRLPNTGSYDWLVPDEVRGQVMIRLTVRDHGGHQARSATAAVTINAEEPAESPPADLPASDVRDRPDVSNPRLPTPEEAKRARKLYRKGNWHQLRDEHDLAAARYRDALKLDPQLPEALVKLGVSMYALGEYQASAGALELALKQAPADREALASLARTLVALKKYEAAESKLLTIVEHRPYDAEAWLHLGDVAIYMGNEVGARNYYVKAATMQPEATSVITRAQARLDDLAALSRQYRQPPSP